MGLQAIVQPLPRKLSRQERERPDSEHSASSGSIVSERISPRPSAAANEQVRVDISQAFEPRRIFGLCAIMHVSNQHENNYTYLRLFLFACVRNII